MTTHPDPLRVEGVDLPLSLRLDGPVGTAPLLVLGHGAGAGIDHPTMAAIAAAIALKGIAVLRYQFPFMERQGGSGFGRDAPAVATATVAAAVECGRALSAGAPVSAGGHSYGGRMTTIAASEGRLDAARALVLLSFPLHGARRPALERAAHLAFIEAPMLFLSGARDAMAAAPLFENVVADLPDARLLRIPGGDHGWKTAKRADVERPRDAIARHVAAFVSEWV